jgi:hypothetical protein
MNNAEAGCLAPAFRMVDYVQGCSMKSYPQDLAMVGVLATIGAADYGDGLARTAYPADLCISPELIAAWQSGWDDASRGQSSPP